MTKTLNYVVMRRKIKLIFMAMAVALTSSAKEWTLEECIGYALDNNISLKTRQARVDDARLDIDGDKYGLLRTGSG